MSIDSRPLLLARGLLILAGTCWSAAPSSPGRFTPFTLRALPQHAQGDFDGDGRQDLALIQNSADGSHVSVRLSGSSFVLSLDASVAGLIAADIDHDGDVDLIAVAPTGQVIAWLNDGRGRFTLQQASHSNVLSPETLVVDALRDEPMALRGAAPSVEPRGENGTAVEVALIRPPTIPPVFDPGFLSLPRLRAPPLPLSLN
jgi:hypothetical protein